MVRIEVTSEVITPRRPNLPRNQVCYMYTVGKDGKVRPHPERCELPLWDNDSPLPEGHYAPTAGAFYVDKYRNPSCSINVRTLSPIKA